jgi:hypothetical protein
VTKFALAFSVLMTLSPQTYAQKSVQIPDPATICKGTEAASPISLISNEIPKNVIKAPHSKAQLVAPSTTFSASASGFRLDGCLTEPGFKFKAKRVVFLQPPSAPIVHVLAAGDKVSGVPTETFDGDFSKLSIEISLGEGKFLQVKGHAAPQVDKHAIITAGIVTGSSGNEKFDRPLLAGTLFEGDTMSLCGVEGFGQPSIARFEMGTAKFELSVCPIMNTSGTADFKFVGLSVTDSNSKLTPEQQKPITVDADELESVLKIGISHHNLCDRINVRLPHAEYAAVAARQPKGDDGSSCDESSEFNTPAQLPKSKFGLYRIKYSGESFSKTAPTKFSHFILDTVKGDNPGGLSSVDNDNEAQKPKPKKKK